MPETNNLGSAGEAAAVKYLENLGYAILERNWRFKKLEVDIIARFNEEMVFAEVKTRSTDVFGDPEIFVTKKKQRFLIQAANAYIGQTDFNGDARFDILAILQDKQNLVVKHIPNAFYPSII
jgi:putative endonuclease